MISAQYKTMKRFASSADSAYKDKAAAHKQGTECHTDRTASLNVFTCINATAKHMQDCLYHEGMEKHPFYTPGQSIWITMEDKSYYKKKINHVEL